MKNVNGNGLKQAPQLNAKDKFRDVYARLQNSEMAGRITQMMVQRLLENGKKMDQDLGRLLQLVNEMQYKVLAVQQLSGLKVEDLNKITGELRLKDFNEASNKEDIAQEFTVIDTVEEDSTVILTSTTVEPDQGIFRSRVKLADTGVPELIQSLMGKTVGSVVEVPLNGVTHKVELLGVRRPKPEPKVEETETQVDTDVLKSVEA